MIDISNTNDIKGFKNSGQIPRIISAMKEYIIPTIIAQHKEDKGFSINLEHLITWTKPANSEILIMTSSCPNNLYICLTSIYIFINMIKFEKN